MMAIKQRRTALTRRQFVAGAGAMLGGCARAAEREVLTVGLFAGITAPTIPAHITAVRTQGYHMPGEGAAVYVSDASIDASYVHQHRSSAFAAADGRLFRLRLENSVDTRALGLRTGLSRGFAQANRQAIADALNLGSAISLPAGDIDLIGAGPLLLPARDGIHIAGQGWATRLVTSDSAFVLPTLSHLEIRDFWVEQTVTSNAAIQSSHENLRDVRLLRLKITMRDQSTCQNNCISLVVDRSVKGLDGITGIDGVQIEDCWLAPGRMGIEIQNHRAGDDRNKLYGYRGVLVKGCTIWKAPVFAGMGVSLTGWGVDCTIEGNRFVGCHGPNVEIVGSDRTRIASNIFEEAIGSPIVVSNYRVVSGLSVVNNKTTGTAPVIGFALNSVDGADVSRNQMTTRGTFIVKGRNVRIHDNLLTGEGTSQLIQLDNARNVLIENNVLKSHGKDPNPRAMVIAFNDTRNCTIRRNRLERADYDVMNKELWIAQSPQVRGTSIYANERRNARQRIVEPAQ